MILAKIKGLDTARSKIRAIGTSLRGPLQDALVQEGRLVAISFAKSTQPYGTGDQARSFGRNRVAADIYKVYATPGKAYADLRDHHLAKAFWLLLQQGHAERAAKILQANGNSLRSVPWIRFDGGFLHISSRSANTGRVSLKIPQAIVRNPRQLAAYIAKKQKLVGFGKSAWADVARQLGGIRGLRAAGDITANWITRNGGRGTVLLFANGSTGGNVRIRLTSTVRYGDRILPKRDRVIAVQIARERLIASIRIAKQYELRHLRRAA